VYFNTSSENTAAIKYSNIDDMAAILDKLIPSDHNSQLDHAFVMKPISGVLKAMIDKGDQFVADRPRVHLDFNLQEVGLGLNPGQYRRILDVVDFFANYNLNLPVRTPDVCFIPATVENVTIHFVFGSTSNSSQRKTRRHRKTHGDGGSTQLIASGTMFDPSTKSGSGTTYINAN
jgi:hypothetical protein